MREERGGICRTYPVAGHCLLESGGAKIPGLFDRRVMVQVSPRALLKFCPGSLGLGPCVGCIHGEIQHDPFAPNTYLHV